MFSNEKWICLDGPDGILHDSADTPVEPKNFRNDKTVGQITTASCGEAMSIPN